jgi:hypothetical protein
MSPRAAATRIGLRAVARDECMNVVSFLPPGIDGV